MKDSERGTQKEEQRKRQGKREKEKEREREKEIKKEGEREREQKREQKERERIEGGGKMFRKREQLKLGMAWLREEGPWTTQKQIFNFLLCGNTYKHNFDTVNSHVYLHHKTYFQIEICHVITELKPIPFLPMYQLLCEGGPFLYISCRA